MKRVLVFPCLFLVVLVSVSGQRQVGEEVVDGLKNLGGTFVALVNEGSYAKAFELIRNAPRAIGDEQLDTLEESASQQLERVREAYGEILETQYIGYNSLSNFLLRFVYVTRYQRHIVWWQVVFYRGIEDRWLFSSISYEDDVDALMDLTF